MDGGHGLSEEEVTKIKEVFKNKLQPLLISGCSLFFHVCLNDLVLLLMKASARAKSPA